MRSRIRLRCLLGCKHRSPSSGYHYLQRKYVQSSFCRLKLDCDVARGANYALHKVESYPDLQWRGWWKEYHLLRNGQIDSKISRHFSMHVNLPLELTRYNSRGDLAKSAYWLGDADLLGQE